MRQEIQVRLEDKPGALMRIAGILSAKGINIETLIVSSDPFQKGFSNMILIADVEARLRVRVLQEMNRLVNVLVAIDVTEQQRGAKPVVRLPLEAAARFEPLGYRGGPEPECHAE